MYHKIMVTAANNKTVFSLNGRVSLLLGTPKAAFFISLLGTGTQVNEGHGYEFCELWHLPSST